MKQEKQEHDMCKTNIQQDFIVKKETKQSYNKKIYLKLVLNKLKIMKNSTYIYIP
jgi:hypothetical protein